MSSEAPAISVRDLVKSFGDVKALAGVDLDVTRGTVLGLLGPNGAGKTTFVRVLTTLLRADGGTASVLGLDVVQDAAELRQQIGLAGQYAAVDENLTRLENLVMVGRLYGMSRRKSTARGKELLASFDLEDAAKRPVKTYSGGMRRRLDLGAALVAKPPVLFLDEPTTGLDPRSRLAMWEVIEGLVSEGTTVLLTTQYLDEADRLANMIAVVDHGLVIAQGTSDELKDRVGGERLEVTLEDGASFEDAVRALAPMAEDPPSCDGNLLTMNVRQRHGTIVEAVRRLGDAGVDVEDLAPNRRISPASHGRSPVTRLKSVVLPAPFGPMMRRRSPGMTVSDTSFMAGRPPNAFLRRRNCSAGVIVCSSARAQPSHARNEPVRHENDDHDEDEAEQHVPPLDVRGHVVLQHHHDRRADHRARRACPSRRRSPPAGPRLKW